MNRKLRDIILSFLAISILVLSCKQKSDISELSENVPTEVKDTILNLEEKKIIATVEKVLFAVGTYNLEDLDSMISDKAMLGISSLRNGTWSNSEITIDEYFENVKKRNLTPYYAKANDYKIMLSEGRLAMVRADAIIHQFGIPEYREINNFLLMKENDNWKFLNISFTVKRLEEEKRTFDLEIFAQSYAQAWSSKRPGFVSSYFTKDGALKVNDGKPAKGTEAIINVAKGFMETFPDMIVSMDSLTTKLDKTRFYWTLTGTNDVPNGTGNKVKISGFEEWTLNKDGLIQESKGYFDEKEYKRQLEFGIN